MAAFGIEQIVQVGAQGAVLREIMEFVQIRWKPTNGELKPDGTKKTDPVKVRMAVTAVAALAVQFLGFEPSTVLQMDVAQTAKFAVDTVLLGGAAMGTHDVLDFFKKARG